MIRETHPDVPCKKIAGLRDILIHAYFGIDLELIWDVTTTNYQHWKQALSRSFQNGEVDQPGRAHFRPSGGRLLAEEQSQIRTTLAESIAGVISQLLLKTIDGQGRCAVNEIS